MARPREDHIAEDKKTQAAVLTDRLAMFYNSEWEDLVAHATSTFHAHASARRSPAQVIKHTKDRVSTLAKMNEKGRALAATKTPEP